MASSSGGKNTWLDFGNILKMEWADLLTDQLYVWKRDDKGDSRFSHESLGN